MLYVYELPDDDLGHICTQLDLLSGLGLASTAKTILSQARRLKLRGRADAASETIQRAFRHYYWASSLRQLLAKKEPIGEDAVAYQANKAKDSILARFAGLVNDSKTKNAAFKQMKTAFTILGAVRAHLRGHSLLGVRRHGVALSRLEHVLPHQFHSRRGNGIR